MDVLGYLLTGGQFVDGQSAAVPDPAWLGGRMAELYSSWTDPAKLDLTAVAEGFLRRLDHLEDPIGQACLQAAADVGRWRGLPYHSVSHHAEVATNAMVMTEVARRGGQSIPLRDRALLLASALAHDLNYKAGLPRFATETEAAQALDLISAQCGVPGPDREMLKCLILATEPGFRSCLAALSGSDLGNDVPQSLYALVAQPALAGLAVTLSDADLLSSAGLTEDWHRVQLERLQSETGCHISPADDVRFFERLVGADFLSRGGRFFSPNHKRIPDATHRGAAACHAAPTLPADQTSQTGRRYTNTQPG
jgi:hypothetical protein